MRWDSVFFPPAAGEPACTARAVLKHWGGPKMVWILLKTICINESFLLCARSQGHIVNLSWSELDSVHLFCAFGARDYRPRAELGRWVPEWSAERGAGQIKGNWISVTRAPRWHGGPDGEVSERKEATKIFLAMSAGCFVLGESLRVAGNGGLWLTPLPCWGRKGLVQFCQPTGYFY